nr:immunoglobulin heavy chain junction region [Macaca mulatta]
CCQGHYYTGSYYSGSPARLDYW